MSHDQDTQPRHTSAQAESEPLFSIIIPVFNRPDEVDELLDSLTRQQERDFEVVVVEDGSQTPCLSVCDKYQGRVRLRYFAKPNSGPGQSRNYGVERANGRYMLILDSDVVLPEGYLTAIKHELRREPADAFGGPDRAHHSFSDTQKAISYAMTSFFTTGGIRGGKKKLDKFYPRSFNMGVRRDVYQQLGGFSKMRFGEDIDFSIRIFKAGDQCRLFPDAWVYHKRRTDFRKFWRQVYNSGIARINLFKRYPDSLKAVHLLPMIFTLGTIALTLFALLGAVIFLFGHTPAQHSFGVTAMTIGLLPLVLYAILIFADAAILFSSAKIGLLAIRAAFTQLMGYGCGFIGAAWKRLLWHKDDYSAYNHNFYK